MTKTLIKFYSISFILNITIIGGNLPATYTHPSMEYYNVKESLVKDDQFQQAQDYSSISKCNEKVYLSYLQAKDLETCVFQETRIRTINNKRHDYADTANFENCLQKISSENRRYRCDEQLNAFSKKVKNNVARRMPHKHKSANYDEMLNSYRRNIQNNWLRAKRELTSKISDDCETKLKESFECYRSELASLAASLESHKSNSLTTESRILHQNMAGCDLVDNILNKCDQLLCNPSSHSDSNVETYNEYVRTVLPEFDVNKCATF